MARARNIKPGFFTNDKITELPMEARLLFIGLWTVADREGRLEDRPKKIKIEIFPCDDINVDHMLSELSRFDFIRRYEVAGVRYIQVINFTRHQSPHKNENPSVIPPLPEDSGTITNSTEVAPEQHQSNHADRGKRNEERGMRNEDIPPQATANIQEPEKRKRKTQISEDFPVTEDMYAYGAKASALLPDEVDTETEKFHLHHKAKGTVHQDWYAAWQYWIRCVPQFKRNLTPINGSYRGKNIGLSDAELDERIRRDSA